jgi:hypothetical protein
LIKKQAQTLLAVSAFIFWQSRFVETVGCHSITFANYSKQLQRLAAFAAVRMAYG